MLSQPALSLNSNLLEYYLITNVQGIRVTEKWIVETYSERNWVEVFAQEAKSGLGLSEYQVREKKSFKRHFILIFCAYTFNPLLVIG